MNYCLRRAIIGFFLLCIACKGLAQSLPDTATLRALGELKKQDDLEEWIYQRIAFVDKNAPERIGFLMQTQQEAWRSYKTYGERVAWFNMLALQGYYMLQSGNILSSISAYENALQFFESYPLEDADVVEYVLKPLGNNYTRLADYNTALFIHQKTLDAATKKGDRNTIASVYSNMAACARWKGDLLLATNFCKAGISNADKKKPLYGLLLSTYADILSEQQRYDTAAMVAQQALRLLKNSGNDMQAIYWYTSALQIAARIALNQSAFSTARQHAMTAIQLFEKYYPGMRQREKAKLQVLLGDIVRSQNNMVSGANIYYQQALELLLPNWKPRDLNDSPPDSILYSENTFGDALAGKAAELEFRGNKELALQHYLLCFAAERKLRSAFFYTESKYKEIAVTRSRANAAMRITYSLWKETGQKKYLDQLLLIAELSKAQVLADERNLRLVPRSTTDTVYRKINQLQEAINYYQHELVVAKDKMPVKNLLQSAEYELALINKKLQQSGQDILTTDKLGGMLRAIPQNVTVLSFFEGDDASYIIEANAGGVQTVRSIPGSKTMGAATWQFVKQWFAGGAGAMLNAPQQFYTASHGLYQSVFGDYTWKPAQRYILIPDGVFSYLPFDALLTDAGKKSNYSDWPWLFRKANLSQAWSLQTWHQQQSTTYLTGAFNGFFVSGGQQLKLSVEEEYRSLQPLVSGRYYVNASATWQQFNAAVDSATVLHIGSHAMTASGDSIPFLQLYDKPFYLFDLRYKKFTPALVVLGACKTADGLLLAGEGINSLSRGFTAAGAGGVVSGLWNVNDETAIAFMKSFYEQLREHDPAMALQEAKKQWLNDHRDNPALQLPYYWSGFVYNGHLQTVHLQQAKSKAWYYGLALAILVFTGILFRFLQMRKRRKT